MLGECPSLVQRVRLGGTEVTWAETSREQKRTGKFEVEVAMYNVALRP